MRLTQARPEPAPAISSSTAGSGQRRNAARASVPRATGKARTQSFLKIGSAIFSAVPTTSPAAVAATAPMAWATWGTAA